MPEIIAGRDWDDLKKYGSMGTIVIGKNIVGTGAEVHLTTPILIDVLRPHVVVVVGKRGTGKSYTSQIFAEEMTKLPEEVKRNLCIVSIDTQGIFWTMKYPNHKQRDLLYEWGLKPQSFEAFEYVPIGHVKKFEEMGVVVDSGFSFRPNDLSASDWCYTFGLARTTLMEFCFQGS